MHKKRYINYQEGTDIVDTKEDLVSSQTSNTSLSLTKAVTKYVNVGIAWFWSEAHGWKIKEVTVQLSEYEKHSMILTKHAIAILQAAASKKFKVSKSVTVQPSPYTTTEEISF
jgi:hypothetical protein